MHRLGQSQGEVCWKLSHVSLHSSPAFQALQSGIHSMFKLNWKLKTVYFVLTGSILFPDATGSKRFILNVEVTPEHRPRRQRPHPRPRLHQDTVTRGMTMGEDRIHSVIVKEAEASSVTSGDLRTSQTLGGSRRSIFSALGQWLCQGQAAGPEALYASPGGCGLSLEILVGNKPKKNLRKVTPPQCGGGYHFDPDFTASGPGLIDFIHLDNGSGTEA